MKRIPDPDWFAFVRPGDVLQRGKNGTLRVVRDVSRWSRVKRVGRFGYDIVRGHGPLRSVTFAIRHPSWTGRAYTVYNANDLKTNGWRYVGARVRLDTEMDRKIHEAITEDGWKRPFALTAKGVRGVA